MSGPIYKLFLLKPLPSWYALSEEEQNAIDAKVAESRDKVGAKLIVACESAWSSEQWMGFGVEEFPDIEAVQKHTAYLNQLNWPHQYAESMTLLGTKWELG
jgi:hypothetical protein